ncbi:hypothetical protein N9R79_03495 [Vibrio sp.]|nr:hypothetical protein [Vibrio sp.]
MNSLGSLLTSMGALPDSFQHTPEVNLTQWEQFSHSQVNFFDAVCQSHPNKSTHSHLLGLLTKCHIEHISRLESNQDSVLAMKHAIHDTVGYPHSDKFQVPEIAYTLFITHLWLYTQGFLKMDFSLANDHADNTAHMIFPLLNQEQLQNYSSIDGLRTNLTQSFYLGKNGSPYSSSSSWSRLLNFLKNRMK